MQATKLTHNLLCRILDHWEHSPGSPQPIGQCVFYDMMGIIDSLDQKALWVHTKALISTMDWKANRLWFPAYSQFADYWSANEANLHSLGVLIWMYVQPPLRRSELQNSPNQHLYSSCLWTQSHWSFLSLKCNISAFLKIYKVRESNTP